MVQVVDGRYIKSSIEVFLAEKTALKGVYTTTFNDLHTYGFCSVKSAVSSLIPMIYTPSLFFCFLNPAVSSAL